MDLRKELLIGYIRSNEERTKATLGDRSQYVGMSDIGKAFGCFRSAVASKVSRESLYPTKAEVMEMTDDEVKEAIKRIRPLERGHNQEGGLVAARRALGYTVIEQLEITVVHEGVTIKAHLDLTCIGNNVIRIEESKSNKTIPETLYVQYEAQLHGQIGLLKRFMHEPVFSVPDGLGGFIVKDVPFAAVVSHFTGQDNPVSQLPIEGQVTSMSAEEMEPFGPYFPNDIMTNLVLEKAVAVNETANKVLAGEMTLEHVEFVKGFFPLCDYCDHNGTCPKFRDVLFVPELEGMLVQYDEARKAEKLAKNDVDALKKQIVMAFNDQDKDEDGFIITGSWRFKEGIQNRTRFDKSALPEHLKSAGLDDDTIQSILENCKASSTSKTLYVKPVKQKKEKKTKKAA